MMPPPAVEMKSIIRPATPRRILVGFFGVRVPGWEWQLCWLTLLPCRFTWRFCLPAFWLYLFMP